MAARNPVPARDKILRAAAKLLGEQGHEKFSLRAVARRARFAPASLYEHFSDRSDLLEALALRAMSDLRADILHACALEGPPSERLLAAAMSYLRFATARPNEFRLCFSRPRPASLTEPAPDSGLFPVVAEVARAVSAGELVAPRDLTPLDMALSVWTQAHGMAELRMRYLPDAADFEARAQLILAATIASWRPAGLV